MGKIVGTILTLVLFASISLIIYSLNDQSVSAANFGAPNLAQDMLKQKSMQAGPNDQTSEIQGEQFPSSQGEGTFPGEVTTQPSNIEKFKVNVKFDEITVHNDHEGAFSGDGEYDLKVYVHGILLDLTKLSKWRDAGLGDVSNGETVRFSPASIMSVNMDSTLPLTIVTAGVEDDGCKGPILPANIQAQILSTVADETAKQLGAPNGTQGGEPNAEGSEKKASGPSTLKSAGGKAGAAAGEYYYGEAGKVVGEIVGEKVGGFVSSTLSKVACKINADDKIGVIEETYIGPSYGAGPHTVKSSSGDFTLTYTITAQRVQ